MGSRHTSTVQRLQGGQGARLWGSGVGTWRSYPTL